MHNNFYLLQQLGNRLRDQLMGAVLYACYSQDRNELILEFRKKESQIFMHAVVRSDLSLLRFPTSLQRARKNTVDLFPQVLGLPVDDTFCFENERCLCLKFQHSWSVLFKMFGRQSNVILCNQNQVVSLFKNNLKQDSALEPSSLNRKLTVDRTQFNRLDGNFQKMIPTLGAPVKKYLEDNGYLEADLNGKWAMLQKMLKTLQDPQYYFHWSENMLPVVTLFDPGTSFFKCKDVIECLNEFYHQFTGISLLEGKRKSLLQSLQGKKKKAESYLNRIRQRLFQIQEQMPHGRIADIIMAHMHLIPKGINEITLPDFETGQRHTIKLKPTLSPQKNAEYYYRKSKNQKKELNILKKNQRGKVAELSVLKGHIDFVSTCTQLKALKEYAQRHALGTLTTKTDSTSQFKSYTFQDYTILVGKSASNNDVLTQKHAYKEDLWLHARDVKGSHVIIKYKAGRPFPAPVIERAAQLAAFFSKRRNDSLCPVTYTEKKFVRKPKGAAPGQVVVEREQVILVVPTP